MDYFDYSSEGYGKPEAPIRKYSFFIHLEATHIGGAFELELYFYYRLQDESIIEFLLGIPYDDDQQTYSIIGRFHLNEPFYKQLLMKYLRKFILDGRNYLGLGYNFKESKIVGEMQFKHMLEDIFADLQINRYLQQTKWQDSPTGSLCREHGLEIIPTAEEDHIAECRCPAGNSHRLKLNLDSGSWYCGYCGYCRKNGYLKELQTHINNYQKK